ncbi:MULTISPECIES: MarR family winged helix-turn-helix transcriptional regulator [unclassified Streptomyces]|uniref:MarR family winged helix-turn-helix transcriptional regulator n=1 Tax=unclassified Streptomyces TaxID=2593676 RepID=UPI00109EBC35|nr:MarR family transcriptional regulator [Streptomyces sp. A1136]THA52859.1 MarR family transcriptional regulator [Streptomyces sp. A1136]
MPHSFPLPSRHPGQVATEASALLELLDVLWGRGQEAVPTPVPPSQLRALAVIDERERVNLRDLGEALGSTPPSVSRLCDRLEAAGLVRRSRATANRREVEVRLSRSGLGVLASVRAARAKELETVLARLSGDERRALFDGLTAFREAAGDKLAGRSIRASGDAHVSDIA